MNLPDKGYYYHYKHNPKLGINDHAYELVGVAKHTEDATYTVIYKPLYRNDFLGSAKYFSRPLEMFMDEVMVNSVRMPRFTKIIDPTIVYKLDQINKTI